MTQFEVDGEKWLFHRSQESDTRLDVILKAAARCFNEKGISGTSLKDVARRLGLTDAALYHYVHNKDDLVFRCYMKALDIGEEAMDRALLKDVTSLEQLQLYIRYQIESVCGVDGPVAVLSETAALKNDHRGTISKRSRRHTERFTTLLEKGVADGSMQTRTPALSANAILGAINWIPKWYRPGGSLSGSEIASAYALTLTDGLRTR